MLCFKREAERLQSCWFGLYYYYEIKEQASGELLHKDGPVPGPRWYCDSLQGLQGQELQVALRVQGDPEAGHREGAVDQSALFREARARGVQGAAEFKAPEHRPVSGCRVDHQQPLPFL